VGAAGVPAEVLSWSDEEYGRALLAHRTVD